MKIGFDYDRDALRKASREEQIETMEFWFRAHFEDPAVRTPYESREGGYIWIWGGPYGAEVALREEFEGVASEEAIDELARRLEGECPEWARIPGPEAYDEGLYDAVSANAIARETLDDALETIHRLLDLEVDPELGGAFRRLLFANVIAAMETYLSDTFINKVFEDSGLLQRYLDTAPEFQTRKIPYKDLLREAGRVEDAARRELLDVVWHNIGKVKAMYANVLGIDLGDVRTVSTGIQLRHDIVHRNGRGNDGAMVEVDRSDIHELSRAVIGLASRIGLKLDFGLDEGDLSDLGF